ncbi:zinc finger protein 345-like [Schistocerca nitens]|uniref:zinc finger protein 345-like n=1 Tax=Schistocerca nitens TaxID=7011 RepID=UPI0021196579|nr:zinc finger protein 345-like [Schistocerca nitens]
MSAVVSSHDATVAQIFGDDCEDIELLVSSGKSKNSTPEEKHQRSKANVVNGAVSPSLPEQLATEENIFKLHGIDLQFPIECDFCLEKFIEMDSFESHMVQHKECRFFTCQLCPRTYVSWGNLVAHRKVQHRGQVLSCGPCGKRRYHPGLGPVHFPVDGFPIGCEECCAGFTSTVQLYRHYRCHVQPQSNAALDKQAPFALPGTNLYGPPPPQSLQCRVCRTEFSSEEQMAAHHIPDKPLSCSLCGRQFCEQRVLRIHRRRCHPNGIPAQRKSYLCPQCGRVFGDRGRYRRHREAHLDKQPHRCEVCPRGFSTQQALARHTFLAHPHRQGFRCQDCRLSFRDSNALRDHIRKDHPSNSSLVCDVCHDSWPAASFLAHYLSCRSVGDGAPCVTCAVCQKVFSRPGALDRHLRLHNPTLRKGHRCDICDRTVLKAAQMPAHILTHFGGEVSRVPERYRRLLSRPRRRIHTCEYCGRDFPSSIRLRCHIRRHTGERPYTCQLCGKNFYTNLQLVVHVRHHAGERTYRCPAPSCPRAFASASALRAHCATHARVKQYNCPQCGKAFFWRSAFVAHARQHTGSRPYVCGACNKSFTLRGKLSLHLRRKHAAELGPGAEGEEGPRYCADCGRGFRTGVLLVDHAREAGCVTPHLPEGTG